MYLLRHYVVQDSVLCCLIMVISDSKCAKKENRSYKESRSSSKLRIRAVITQQESCDAVVTTMTLLIRYQVEFLHFFSILFIFIFSMVSLWKVRR